MSAPGAPTPLDVSPQSLPDPSVPRRPLSPDCKPDVSSLFSQAPPQYSSGPLPGPGETLVGVIDSQWPLADPRGLFPGDIILRIGRRGQAGTVRAPFYDGLATVKQCVGKRASSDEQVLVQVLRGSSKLELLVSPCKAPRDPAQDSARSAGGQAQAQAQGQGGGQGQGILEGVVLSEGQHSKFAPLAARTEHNILRLERMKAYGLAPDAPWLSLSPPGDAGEQPRQGKGPRRALWFSLRRRRGRKDVEGAARGGAADEAVLVQGGPVEGVSLLEEEEEQGGSEEESEEGAGEEEDSAPRGLTAGSILSVAASVLPSDPQLEADEDDICLAGADAFSLSFDPASLRAEGLHLDDCSVGSGDLSQQLHPELLSGPLGFTTRSAPGGPEAPGPFMDPSAAFHFLPTAEDSDRVRLYTRPDSPLLRLTRHASQPDVHILAEEGPCREQQAGACSPLPLLAPPAPNFQIRRKSIPEHVGVQVVKEGKDQGPTSLFTILVLPSESASGSSSSRNLRSDRSRDLRRFSDVNHTIERAMRWFQAVKNSGAALTLMNAQTEVLPLRLGGMDSQKLAKVAQYGKWMVKTGDSTRGDHISVLRAVRLWLVPSSEVELTLCMSSKDDSCPDWGLQLSQTRQGVVHVTHVAPGSAADKAGVHMLLRMALSKQQLLTVTKLQSHVLVPSMISDDGVDCVDVGAIQEQLILHAHLQSSLEITLAM